MDTPGCLREVPRFVSERGEGGCVRVPEGSLSRVGLEGGLGRG